MLFNIMRMPGIDLVAGLVLFAMVAAALVVSISIHEFSHAFASLKLGDPTAKSLGRVTLNPKAHLDPMGTLMLVLFGFGWGKPVPFDPSFLKNPKRDSAIIAFAGPLSNVILASLLAGIYHLFGLSGFVGTLFEFTIFYNLILGFFNLLPVHPLDGFKVVNGLLPDELSYQWLQMAPYGLFILILLIVTDATNLFITPLLNLSLSLLGM